MKLIPITSWQIFPSVWASELLINLSLQVPSIKNEKEASSVRGAVKRKRTTSQSEGSEYEEEQSEEDEDDDFKVSMTFILITLYSIFQLLTLIVAV